MTSPLTQLVAFDGITKHMIIRVLAHVFAEARTGSPQIRVANCDLMRANQAIRRLDGAGYVVEVQKAKAASSTPIRTRKRRTVTRAAENV